MSSIPIKIEKQSPPDARTSRPEQITTDNQPKRRHSKIVWLLIAAVIILLAIVVFLWLNKTTSPYQRLIPENPIAVLYFDSRSLINLVKPLENAYAGQTFFNSAKEGIQGFIAKAGLDFVNLKTGLKDKMTFAVTDNFAPFNWLVLAQIADADRFDETMLEAQTKLKQNFNLLSESYRQTDIIQIKLLNGAKNSVYFTQTAGFLIVSNNIEEIKATINRAIE